MRRCLLLALGFGLVSFGSPQGLQRVWLVRNNEQRQEIVDIEQDSVGNAYTLGRYSFAGDWGVIVSKYNPMGQRVWQRKFSQDSIRGFRLDSSGNLILIGSTYGAGGSFVKKLSFAGSTVWQRNSVPTEHWVWFDFDSNGEIALTGSAVVNGVRRIRNARIRSNASLIWTRDRVNPFPSSNFSFHDVVVDNSGAHYFMGGITSTSTNTFLGKYSKTGQLEWFQTLQTSDSSLEALQSGFALATVTGERPKEVSLALYTSGGERIGTPLVPFIGDSTYTSIGQLVKLTDSKFVLSISYASDQQGTYNPTAINFLIDGTTIAQLAPRYDSLGGIVAMGEKEFFMAGTKDYETWPGGLPTHARIHGMEGASVVWKDAVWGNGYATAGPVAGNGSGEITMAGTAIVNGVSSAYIARYVCTPLARNDSYEGMADEPIIAESPGVLANDFQVFGGQVILSRQAEHGTLSLDNDGSFIYTPNPGFAGEDSAEYDVVRGTYTSRATIRFTIQSTLR